jgi:phosphotransferase system HPr (HPr) family protein
MIEGRVEVVNRLGLHARAAARVVRTANCFKSSLRLERMDGSAAADAKSISSVLLLAASRGTILRAIVDGADEQQALGALCKLFAERFGEGE